RRLDGKTRALIVTVFFEERQNALCAIGRPLRQRAMLLQFKRPAAVRRDAPLVSKRAGAKFVRHWLLKNHFFADWSEDFPCLRTFRMESTPAVRPPLKSPRRNCGPRSRSRISFAPASVSTFVRP